MVADHADNGGLKQPTGVHGQGLWPCIQGLQGLSPIAHVPRMHGHQHPFLDPCGMLQAAQHRSCLLFKFSLAHLRCAGWCRHHVSQRHIGSEAASSNLSQPPSQSSRTPFTSTQACLLTPQPLHSDAALTRNPGSWLGVTAYASHSQSRNLTSCASHEQMWLVQASCLPAPPQARYTCCASHCPNPLKHPTPSHKAAFRSHALSTLTCPHISGLTSMGWCRHHVGQRHLRPRAAGRQGRAAPAAPGSRAQVAPGPPLQVTLHIVPHDLNHPHQQRLTLIHCNQVAAECLYLSVPIESSPTCFATCAYRGHPGALMGNLFRALRAPVIALDPIRGICHLSSQVNGSSWSQQTS